MVVCVLESFHFSRSDDYAERLFTELKDVANSQTYEVFILGLLQVGFVFISDKILKSFYFAFNAFRADPGRKEKVNLNFFLHFFVVPQKVL